MSLFGSGTSSTADKALPAAQGDGASEELDLAEALREMSFLDHLEELRWRLLRGLGGILLGAVICGFFDDFIIDEILLGPTYPDFFMYQIFGFEATPLDLLNRTITGQFFAYWGSVIVVGVILGSPVFIYQMWKFIEPGLYPDEKKGMRFASVFATGFFVLGILFGYCIITPMALQFFANFIISDQILNQFDITKYFGMVTMWVFGVGVLFELPVLMYFLAKLGLVSSEVMRKSRKYAFIIVLILAAVMTPPDPVSQLLIALPMMGLYELSIWITKRVERRREREMKKALG
ncbi:MAG: twin-arginine translocase subunit TatC [Rhodothermales bacterium]